MEEKNALFEKREPIGPTGYAPPQYTEKPPIPIDDLPPVNQQPLPIIQRVPKRKDYYDLSLCLIIIWLMACLPCLLCCSMPALYLAHKARKDFAAGNEAAGEKRMRTALLCNLVAIGMGIMFLNIFGAMLGGAIPLIVRATQKES